MLWDQWLVSTEAVIALNGKNQMLLLLLYSVMAMMIATTFDRSPVDDGQNNRTGQQASSAHRFLKFLRSAADAKVAVVQWKVDATAWLRDVFSGQTLHCSSDVQLGILDPLGPGGM